jgi:hypothetical protein
VGHGELTLLDGCSERLQNLAELGLGPRGAEGALAGADHGDPLLAKRVVGEGPRGPVEGVLERTGDGAVVFRSREQQSVRSRDFVPEEGDRLRLDLDVLVVRRILSSGFQKTNSISGPDSAAAASRRALLYDVRRRLPLIASRRISGSS